MQRKNKTTPSGVGIRSVFYDRENLIRDFDRVMINIISLSLGALPMYSKPELPGYFFFEGTAEQAQEAQAFLNTYTPTKTAKGYKAKYFALLEQYNTLTYQAGEVIKRMERNEELNREIDRKLDRVEAIRKTALLPNLDATPIRN